MNEAQHLEEKSESVAVEQQGESQEQAEQQAPGEKSEVTSAQNAAAPEAPARKKRRKKAPPPRIEDITPRPSFWPILLAAALCVTVIGLDIHPVVFVLGLLLVITAIIGWGVERR
jgi:Flp pilus assembly protein TadB